MLPHAARHHNAFQTKTRVFPRSWAWLLIIFSLFPDITLLQEGDLLLTGTPSGVGPVKPGDVVECVLADSDGKELDNIKFDAVERQGGYHYQAA